MDTKKIEADLDKFLTSDISSLREEKAWHYVVNLLGEIAELRARPTITDEMVERVAAILYNETYEWRAFETWANDDGCIDDKLRQWHRDLARKVIAMALEPKP